MDFYTCVAKIGDTLYVRGYKDGKRVVEKEHYEPILFTVATEKDSSHRSIDGLPLKPIVYESMKAARDRLKQDSEMPVPTIFGFENFVVAYICERWPDRVPFDRNLIRIANIDIEVASDKGFPDPYEAKRRIISITLKFRDTIHVWGLKPFNNDRDDVIYYEFTREKKMLEHFLDIWEELDIDVLTGWNIDSFDVPYLYNRLIRLFGIETAKRLSPLGWVTESTRKAKFGKEITVYNIYGLQCIDYLRTYQKFRLLNRESYKLNYIAYAEDIGQKVDYSEYATLSTLYMNDHDKFIRYNITDVELVDKLDKKLGFMDVVFALAYTCHVNFEDVFAQTRNWDALIYNYLIKKNIVVPPQREKEKKRQFQGAFVKDPQVGLHKWVVGYDLTSLYPHLIMQYHLSPDTFIEDEYEDFRIEDIHKGLVKNDTPYIMAANGHYFRKDIRGFLPEILEDMFAQRQHHKKLMLEAERNNDEDAKLYHNSMQATLKTTLNSAYGTMGSAYFRFFRLPIAEAVTTSGQLSIQWVMNKINQYLNKVCKTKDFDFVIASDTDSMYLTLEPLVEKFCEDPNDTEAVLEFIETITDDRLQTIINKSFEDLAKIMGCPQNRLHMKRESISDRAVWVAKKRYALNMLVSEAGRLPEPKIKITGLEAVRTTVPEVARNAIKKSVEIIMRGTNEEFIEYINKIRHDFDTLPLEDIAKPIAVSNLAKFRVGDKFLTGTPMHVKAAHHYNDALREWKLNNKYESIRDGDNLKCLYLKKPNPLRVSVIGFTTVIPKEFGIERFIDRDMMFEKMFMSPVKKLAETVGWDTERRSRLKGIKRYRPK